jgi:hypothetical protein
VQATVARCLGAACALLSRRRLFPALPLRILEVTIFGLMAAALMAGQYRRMLVVAALDNPTEFQAVVKNSLFGSVMCSTPPGRTRNTPRGAAPGRHDPGTTSTWGPTAVVLYNLRTTTEFKNAVMVVT